MTPEKALAILEGKIARRELPKGTLDEKKIQPSIKKAQDGTIISLDKYHNFFGTLAIVLILGVLIAVYLWRFAAVSEKSYKNGFNDGVSSISMNLTLAQKDISGKVQKMNQLLQQDLGKSKDSVIQLQLEVDTARQNLESMTQQKEQLAQILKQTQESVSNKIKDLHDQLDSAQRDISEKNKQLSDLQKAIVQRVQERDQAQEASVEKEKQLVSVQKDLNDKIQRLNKLQQEMAKIKQDLKPVTQQKGRLQQNFK